ARASADLDRIRDVTKVPSRRPGPEHTAQTGVRRRRSAAAGHARVIARRAARRRNIGLTHPVIAVPSLLVVIPGRSHTDDACDLARGLDVILKEMSVAHVETIVDERGDWKDAIRTRELHSAIEQDVVGVIAAVRIRIRTALRYVPAQAHRGDV